MIAVYLNKCFKCYNDFIFSNGVIHESEDRSFFTVSKSKVKISLTLPAEKIYIGQIFKKIDKMRKHLKPNKTWRNFEYVASIGMEHKIIPHPFFSSNSLYDKKNSMQKFSFLFYIFDFSYLLYVKIFYLY